MRNLGFLYFGPSFAVTYKYREKSSSTACQANAFRATPDASTCTCMRGYISLGSICEPCPLAQSTIENGGTVCVDGSHVTMTSTEKCTDGDLLTTTNAFENIGLLVYENSTEKMLVFNNPTGKFRQSAKSVLAYFTVSGFVQEDMDPRYDFYVVRHKGPRRGWQHIMNLPSNLDLSFSVSFPSGIEESLKTGERVSKLVIRVYSVDANSRRSSKNLIGCSIYHLGDYAGSRNPSLI